MARDLIVSDEEYISAAKYIESYGNDIQKSAEKYMEILERVSNGAITDKDICERLRKIRFAVAKVPSLVNNLTDSASAQIKNYVKDIDNADKGLY